MNGIEITAIERGKDVHVLGYFFDPRSSPLAQVPGRPALRIASGAFARWPPGCYSSGARWTSIRSSGQLPPGGSIGRPALADALVACRACDRPPRCFRSAARGRMSGLRGAPGAHVCTVVEKIRTAGGIASLAHPGLTAMDEDIPRFVAAGLSALEARHSDHGADTEQWYRTSQPLSASSSQADPTSMRIQRIMPTCLGGVSLSAEDFAALEFRAPDPWRACHALTRARRCLRHQLPAQPVLELDGIVRGYQSLRPLRLQSLIAQRGERVALMGLDARSRRSAGQPGDWRGIAGRRAPSACMGRDTAAITTGDDWLASLDRFGIVSPRRC